jgi:hypothetical protein
MDLPLGGKVTIEITKLPSAEAARKTLVRLCRKDPAIVRHHRQQQDKRPSWERWRRGGKMWHHQMRTQPAVKITTGQKFNIRATLDVVRDLESVKRFVKVAKS